MYFSGTWALLDSKMLTKTSAALLSTIRKACEGSTRTSANVSVRKPRVFEGGHFSARLGASQPSLVIFDKDGTLLCFHTIIESSVGLSLFKDIYRVLGLCPIENKVKPGLLAEGTMGQITAEISSILTKNGIPSLEARQLVIDSMKNANERSVSPQNVKEIYDTFALFTRLKQFGTKIAVCTADNRKSTLHALERLQVNDLVDFLVCGDDLNTIPKPHPHNARRICESLDIHPSEAIMVGDTRVDIEMAHSAGLGAAVGVLSGVGCKQHLYKADVLLNNVGDIIDAFYDNYS
ncbi:unnamed protein product [Caenorhabditis auriculariae]|uniref:Uncharacterized protein n=1 Tax=Caenorhabditis auriculariae TaxID=2777116 RepID=A0A8S1H0B5_9PELO|nr:unnamed protein product [Caenorhabditis auriculariae]